MILINELKEISAKIDSIIKTDDFPSKILPEHLKNAVLQYPSNAGKRLRPALVLWSCGLLGGDLEKAYYAATAAEVYHNWTLVHDDIIDCDDLRRGKPATHAILKKYAAGKYPAIDKNAAYKFGTDFGILAGDLQQSWALSLLMKSVEKGLPANITLSLCKDMTDGLSRELISGEAIDVELSYKNIENVTSEEVEEMIYLKTAALLSFCVVTGAKIALETDSKKDTKILKLADYASAIGIAFQLKDDWLGIFSDTIELGKTVGCDIISSKPTSLMLTALSSLDTEKKEKLNSYLGKQTITFGDLCTIRDLIRESGAEKATLKKINDLHGYAEKCLNEFPDNKYKQILLELNQYLINRTK
jgi:geranylgeranyl diphosphate synthase, type I